MRILLLFAALILGAAPGRALDDALVKAAEDGMHQAVDYLRSEVAYGGGYLGRYLADLSDQWGEGHATRTQNWIQPPGNPSVGFAFLRAWEATGDSFYLAGAKEVGDSLVYGQLECGGWQYIVDHDPKAEKVYYYRHNRNSDDPSLKAGRNQGTFDDNTTQHATRLLIAVDQALEEKDAPIHEAALAALEYILAAQHQSGGWPQRYPPSGRGYGDFLTYNDNSIRDCVDVLMIASRTYDDPRYAEAVRRCGEFILKTQLPEPQATWAQQYDFDLQPAWARRFEPPAACAGESSGVLTLLFEIALYTGDEKYLEPIPKALDWYERSRLPDGRWARFYELKTNRPLYFTSDNRTTYWLTYDDSDAPDHYAFKGNWNPSRAEKLYLAVKEKGIEKYLKDRERPPLTEEQRVKAAEAMEARVRQVLAAQDDQGRWVTTSGGKQMIYMSAFEKNLGVLARYLKLVNGR